MKHFLVDIQYLLPYEQLADILPAHRSFLQTGYDKGILLMSGPRESRTGGLIVARSETQADLEAFFENDPYRINNSASYTFIEFNPVKFQPWVEDWIKGK